MSYSWKNVVCVFDTFDNNLEIKNAFRKYLKETCEKCLDKHFHFKYFPKYASRWNISPQLSGCFGRSEY